ncbi:DUF7662 domain-containing protein [Salinactinospora qingdaonensis]|uniref:DUF7662 domain-containing protein n=1 Tax=Salinactinospora qingdaonensis TaxID=702744 RepID=UPI0031EF958F
MAKYDPLRDYLAGVSRRVRRVTMSFAAIAALVGPLPRSAWRYRAWWANDNKVEARAWLAAGWRVESVSRHAEQVVFLRRDDS